MKDVTLTYTAFANAIGAHDKLTLEVALVWHREYIKADAATRTARREEFILHFMLGAKVPEAKAVKIMALSRTDRTKEAQKLYDRARAKFTYYIVRPVKKPSSGKADIVAQALALIAQMDAAQKRKVRSAL
jgi:hypothetical protein